MSGCATEECNCNIKGSSLDLFVFTTLLANEIERADAKHGDWRNETTNFMVNKIADEVEEVFKAENDNDKDGEHGMKAELVQVACTAYKMWRSL